MQREQKGCATCHSIDGTRGQGPSWKGIYGKMEKMSDGQSYLVDDAYLQESMMQPNAKVVASFEPIMPSFQGLLHPQDIRGLIAYIKTLK
jgi:cytochrome c oxidase subunit 2